MGRHSAPDDDLDLAPAPSGGVALLERPLHETADAVASVGRHVRADDLEFAWLLESADEPDRTFAGLTPAAFGTANATALAEPLPGADETSAHPAAALAGGVATATIAAAPVPQAVRRRPPGHGVHATRADAGLLGGHSDVRNRAIAALVVPFVVWAVVFAARGDLGAVRSLYWLLVPIVVAGIALGLVLDLGHRRYPPTDDVVPQPV